MQRLRAPALVAAAVVVAVALFLVLRPSDDDTATTTTTTAAPAATRPSTPTQPRPRQTVPTVRIAVRGGEVVGGLRHAKLDRGDKVVLVVRSDVADEVHLHGYDISKDATPGRPVRIAFSADVPGRFEIELEQLGLAIGELEVAP